MPPDRVYVEASLAEIEETVTFLRSLAELPEADFLADPRNRYSACYALMTAIEGTANVASHLLTRSNHTAPRSLAECFRRLVDLGLPLGAELTDRLVLMARFRNLLVHRYWELDYRRVYRTLRGSLGDFGLFAVAVLDFLGAE
ncbi:MAG: DUF86 domain-containing protein [Candidatus Eremiobacterota bacterium]